MASGQTLLSVNSLNNELPASNYAPEDTVNARPILTFSDSVKQRAVFSGIMPQHYEGGGIRVIVWFWMESATSGAVKLDAAFERTSDAVLTPDLDGFATAKSIVKNVAATRILQSAMISFLHGAEIDNLVAGDKFRLAVDRDSPDAQDTASGKLQFDSIELREV